MKPIIFLTFLLAFLPLRAQQNLHYIALELDSLSRQQVLQYAEENLPWSDARFVGHHMTLLHHSGLRTSLPCERTAESIAQVAAEDYILAWTMQHEGETYSLVATEVGHTDRAFALRVGETAVPSRNANKHITLATRTSTGGSAVDSNSITSWQPLSSPLLLSGKVTFYYYK